MRALLITVGSRGDIEPFCALADALASRDHHVDLFLQSDLTALAPSSSSKADNSIVAVHELPFTQQDFYRFVGQPSHGADHPNPRVKFVGVVTDVIGELVLPRWGDVFDVANKGVDVIVTSSLARPLAMAIGQKIGIPICVVHLQPLTPTELFPHFSQTDKCVAALRLLHKGEERRSEEHIGSYWELEKFQYEFLKERLDKVHASFSLPPLPSFDDENLGLRMSLSGHDSKTWIANAFSTPEVIPHCDDSGPNVFNVGPLADAYVPNGWNAPSELTVFLERGKKNTEEQSAPVCVGYGSMPFDKVKVVLQALKEAGMNAVFVGDALKDTGDGELGEWAKTNVFHIRSAPYAWLLPKCSMMLCHGGAGVVNATLRAGIPALISPLIGDQFFYGQLLESMGVGVKAGSSLTAVSREDLVEGIDKALKCIPAARELGKAITSKTLGVQMLVNVLESKVAPAGT